MKDDRCVSGGVVIVTHVVSSRGSGVSSDDSWFHSEREREIRPSPLNIYDLGPHRFLATFFAVFRGGLALGDPHTLTDSRTSMHECSQIHSDIHTCIHCL